MNSKILKWLILFFLCITINVEGNDNYVDKVVDAIYWAEGGAKTKYPYGIKSVKVKSVAEARAVCYNTVNRKHIDWIAQGRKGDFLVFLQKTYCPTSGNLTAKERELNGYWLKNVRYFIVNPKTIK